MSTDPVAMLEGPTMGTLWSVRIDGLATDPGLLARFHAAVDAVDAQMSTWKPDSDLMRLNAAPLDTWVPLPDRLLAVLQAGLAINALFLLRSRREVVGLGTGIFA